MRVALAMLADYALAHDDGKLYVTGGALHQLRFGRLPAVYPRVCLALDLLFEPTELGSSHLVMIEAVDPAGQPYIKPAALTVTPPPPTIDISRTHTQLVYSMVNLTFQAEGEHVFRVTIGGQVQASLPLRVTVVPGSSTEMSALLHRIEEGFAAFGVGDIDGAEQRFRGVVDAMPSMAVAHNNLGFVLLSKGHAEEALASFKQAQEVGFDRPELLDANMGCCYYLLGTPQAALALFDNCLNARAFTGSSVLHGVKGDGLFLVQLPSASAYTRLMALNAGWSALLSARPDLALRYLGMAAGLADIAADPQLAQATDELRAKLK
jgi:tetratricopeptide (TPR) repeat protein